MSEQTAINKVKEILYRNLSYTNQDYESILNDIISLFRGDDKLTTKWDNISEADIMFIFMSLLAAHKDMLNYMIDYRILESYMSTAKERQSLVRIANSFGYKIPSYKAAKTEIIVDTTSGPDPVPSEFDVENFTTFVDANGVQWTYINIAGDAGSVDSTTPITVYQGSPVEVDLLPENFVSRTHIISNQPIAIGNNYNNDGCSILIAVKTDFEPIIFTEVQNLYAYDGTDTNVYELNVDPQGITYIKLSSSINIADFYGYTFNFKYIITGGGSVDSAEVITHVFDEDYTVELSSSDFIGGSNPVTSDEIREGFKDYYASADSLVTLQDYKNYILNIQKDAPEVTKCLVIDSESDTLYGTGDPALDPLNVDIYVLNSDNTVPELGELTALLASLNLQKVTGIKLSINDGGNPSEVIIHVQLDGLDDDSDNIAIKALVADYINGKEIGETLTVSGISTLLVDNGYDSYYNKIQTKIDGGSFSDDDIEIEYYKYLTCDEDNVIDIVD